MSILLFLEKNLGTLTFLNLETSLLKKTLQNEAFKKDQTLQNRLNFILSPDNKLIFSKEKVTTTNFLKETEEKQINPVLIDQEDLKKILALLEEVKIEPYYNETKCPQIIINSFLLEKKENTLKINMNLLKREFL